MTRPDFLLHVFVLVDDPYHQLVRTRLRSRGPRTTALTDPEVLTIELVGEFLGLDQNAGTFTHFARYHRAEFPALAHVHRTTSARRAANLYAIGRQIHKHLADKISAREDTWLIDSLPVHVRKFARAAFCQRFQGEAAYGYDHTRRTTTYGFRLHARTTRAGAIVAFDLAPANVADQPMVDQLDPPPGTVVIGDRNYWSPHVKAELAEGGVTLIAPFRAKSRDPDSARSRRLSKAR
jgi:hypothetical protein